MGLFNRLRSRQELLKIYKEKSFYNKTFYNEANAGDDVAFCNVGSDFAMNHHFREAFECWKNIELKKIPEVYNNLGVSYFYGNGVVLDYKKALEYYRLSASLGNDFGIYNVGVCYELGVGGISKDIPQAIENFKLAASLGNKEAVKSLIRLQGYYDGGFLQNDTPYFMGASQCEIESGTNYEYQLSRLKNINFYEVYKLSVEFITSLKTEEINQLYEKLSRGIEILNSEPVLNMYLYAYGKMHAKKLSFAYNKLSQSFFTNKEITIIDYGCGQGIGFMCYHDFLKDKKIKQKICNLVLIEPSEICLKRACLNAKKFFPDAKVVGICKTFNNLSPGDLYVGQNTVSLHILSNVIDMPTFDITHMVNVLKDTPYGIKQYVCVSPYINNDSSEKLDTFVAKLGGENLITTSSNDGCVLEGKWTYDIRVFTLYNIEYEYNEKIKLAHIKEAQCRAEIDTILGYCFLQDAVEAYLDAIKIYPNPNVYYNLANLYKDFEKYEDAIQYYKCSIELEADNEAYCNMGVCYYNLEDDIHALECFQKAVRLNPNDSISYRNMGNALYNLKEYEEAQKYYDISDELSSDLF